MWGEEGNTVRNGSKVFDLRTERMELPLPKMRRDAREAEGWGFTGGCGCLAF